MILHKLSSWMISDELYAWITNNIKSEGTILELGSGLGSVALSLEYCVYSIEHNDLFIGLGSSVSYFAVKVTDTWYDREDILDYKEGREPGVCQELGYSGYPEDYDLLLIDGPPQDLRLGILDNFDLFRTDRPVIFDDVHRPELLAVVEELAERYGFTIEISKSVNKSFAILRPNPNLNNNGSTSQA